MKNGLTTLIALAALLSAPSVFAEGAGIEWVILNDADKTIFRTAIKLPHCCNSNLFPGLL